MTLEASRNARSNLGVAMPLSGLSILISPSGLPAAALDNEASHIQLTASRYRPLLPGLQIVTEENSVFPYAKVQVIFFVSFVPDGVTRIRKEGDGWFWSWPCGDLALSDSFP